MHSDPMAMMLCTSSSGSNNNNPNNPPPLYVSSGSGVDYHHLHGGPSAGFSGLLHHHEFYPLVKQAAGVSRVSEEFLQDQAVHSSNYGGSAGSAGSAVGQQHPPASEKTFWNHPVAQTSQITPQQQQQQQPTQPQGKAGGVKGSTEAKQNSRTGSNRGGGGHSHTSSSSSKKRKRVATVAQRRAANIRERRRMFNLNEAFDKLRRKVPTFAYEKRLSRIETLRLAITYIGFMDQVIRTDPKANKGNKVAVFANPGPGTQHPPPSEQTYHFRENW